MLVNNAGIGVVGAFEATPFGTVRDVFETNTFTASLALELHDFNVRVKLVEPGYCPTTRFTENGGSRMRGLIPEAYAPFALPIVAAFAKQSL